MVYHDIAAMAGRRTLLKIILVLSYLICTVTGYNITEIGSTIIYVSPLSLQFQPEEVRYLTEGSTIDIYFNYTVHDEQYHTWRIAARIKHPGNAEIVGDNEAVLEKDAARNLNQTKLSIRGVFLGRTLIEFFVQPVLGNISINASDR